MENLNIFFAWLDDNLAAIEPDGYYFYDSNGDLINKKTFSEIYDYYLKVEYSRLDKLANKYYGLP